MTFYTTHVESIPEDFQLVGLNNINPFVFLNGGLTNNKKFLTPSL
jgi:hypothetical protein